MTIKTFDDVHGVFGGMDDSFDDLRRRLAAPWWSGSDTGRQLIDTEEGYALVVDMPGFERDEIDVTVEDGMLSILATHETTDDGHEGDELSLLRASRSRRTHERMRLPEAILVEEITATYRNGVLEVRLPLAGERADTAVDIDVQE